MKNLLLILKVFGEQENIMIVFFFYPESIHLLKWKYLCVHQKMIYLEDCVFLELVGVSFMRQASNARIPLKASPASACCDLYAVESKILKLRERERERKRERERVLIKLQ